MAASEKTLHSALCLYNDSLFRQSRQMQYPGTRPEFDSRAAVFAAMDAEGRFCASYGQPMGPEDSAEFELLSAAVLKISR